MKKKLLTAFTVIAVSTVFSLQAFAIDLTEQQALEAAKTYLPSDAVHRETDSERFSYELKFYSATTDEKYELELEKATGKLLEFTSEAFEDKGGKSVILTTEDVKKIVTDEFADAEFLSVKLDRDKIYQEYDVHFLAKNTYAEYIIHPETGKILEREIEKVTTDVDKIISKTEAMNIALARVPNAYMHYCALKADNGRLIYEGEMSLKQTEYEFEINAVDGAIIEWDVDEDD